MGIYDKKLERARMRAGGEPQKPQSWLELKPSVKTEREAMRAGYGYVFLTLTGYENAEEAELSADYFSNCKYAAKVEVHATTPHVTMLGIVFRTVDRIKSPGEARDQALAYMWLHASHLDLLKNVRPYDACGVIRSPGNPDAVRAYMQKTQYEFNSDS